MNTDGMSTWVRPPAVAGLFYPDDPVRLAEEVDELVKGAMYDADGGPAPKLLVVPHAGYVYSGPTAGCGYARLAPVADVIRRVVLFGPAHRVAVDGMALTGAGSFATPLGIVPVDQELEGIVLAHPAVCVDDRAHAQEHSLEVHLPFLQRLLGAFTVLPLVCGRADADTVADVMALVWGGPETLIVVSTDLSHYHDHMSAQEIDRRPAANIVAREPAAIGPYDACGAVPLRGALELARRRDLSVELIDLRTSGDTAGGRDRVVGYGAFAIA